ncbi:MAG: DNA-directed RNA polymerase subunit alpha [Parcubacteria group bacterium RIFCSPHIGHO2_01_FULL_47_10b]|nr:MAG: DNA-directed RNA polymerase subunit alpha [Parcubacteria group bacterium RIFCSPHIGHO2_01_FULL_47_10b]
MISLPKPPKITPVADNEALFEIEDCYPGYGMTLGNALRRVLLSSLAGSAIKAVRIMGVDHEFSTIDHVKEDVVEILLNLKQVRFTKATAESIRGTLKVTGKKVVKANDFEFPSDVEVVSPDLLIATLTHKDAKLEMEVVVDHGIGYVPREVHKEHGDTETSMLVLDTFYTPVVQVNYRVENMRVGARTDYNRLFVTVKTDGTITPENAFHQASSILVEQFKVFKHDAADSAARAIDVDSVEMANDDASVAPAKKRGKKATEKKAVASKQDLADLKLSSRIVNVLADHGIRTVDGLLARGEEALTGLPGLGEKAIKEIRRKIGRLGLILNK